MIPEEETKDFRVANALPARKIQTLNHGIEPRWPEELTCVPGKDVLEQMGHRRNQNIREYSTSPIEKKKTQRSTEFRSGHSLQIQSASH